MIKIYNISYNITNTMIDNYLYGDYQDIEILKEYCFNGETFIFGMFFKLFIIFSIFFILSFILNINRIKFKIKNKFINIIKIIHDTLEIVYMYSSGMIIGYYVLILMTKNNNFNEYLLSKIWYYFAGISFLILIIFIFLFFEDIIKFIEKLDK